MLQATPATQNPDKMLLDALFNQPILWGRTNIECVQTDADSKTRITPVGEHGRVRTTFLPGETTTMRISLKDDSGIVVFTGNKAQGQPITQVTGTEIEVEGEKVYEFSKVVETKASKPGVYDINFYEGSSLRFLRVDKFGNVHVYETSMVAQEFMIYMPTQEIYTARFYRTDDHKIVCPKDNALAAWSQMVEFVTALFIGRYGNEGILALDHISTYKPKPAVDPAMLGDHEGIVKFWNTARGVGGVQTRNGMAKIHFSQVEVPEGMPKRAIILKAGQRITFNETRKGKKDTSFPFELCGVRIAQD